MAVAAAGKGAGRRSHVPPFQASGGGGVEPRAALVFASLALG